MKKYLSFVKKYALTSKLNIFIIICILITQNIPALVIPILYKKIIDVYLPNKDIDFTIMFLGIILIMNIGKLILNILKDYESALFSENIGKNIRIDLMKKVIFLPYGYFDNNNISNFLSKYDKEVNTLITDLGYMLIRLISSLISISMTAYMIVYLSGKYLIVFAFVFVVFLKTSVHFGKKVSKRAEVFFEKNNSSLSVISDNYRNIPLIKLYNGYKFAIKRFNEKYNSQFCSKIKLEIINSVNINVSGFWIFFLTFVAWVIGVNDIMKGALTIGGLIAIIDYLNMLMSPMNFIPQFIGSYRESLVAIERINSFLNQNDEKNELQKIVYSKGNISKVLVNNVSFGYSKDRNVISNLNLEFNKGNIYGLIGKSGCGKSTLIKLLIGLYAPNSGEITVSKDGEMLTPIQVREDFGYLPQESSFFEDTIYNNLCFDSEIDKDLIIKESKKIDIFQELNNMDEKLDTKINYENSNLSGGQKKRLDLLRILIRDKNIIICDEATSFLDDKRKEYFYRTINEIKKEKIIIIITHNNDESKYFDKIYEIGT